MTQSWFLKLVIWFLFAQVGSALNCTAPPVGEPINQTYFENLSPADCDTIPGSVHLGQACNDDDTDGQQDNTPCLGSDSNITGAVVIPEIVKTIDGDLTCWGNPNITSLKAPGLLNVTGSVIVKAAEIDANGNANLNTNLTTFELPVVTHVGGDFRFEDNDNLVSVEHNAMEFVGRDYYVKYNAKLVSVKANAMKSVGGDYYINVNGNLVSVEHNVMESVGADYYIRKNKKLESVQANAMKSVGGEYYVKENDNLVRMEADALKFAVDSYRLEDNQNLVCVKFGSLNNTEADRFVFSGSTGSDDTTGLGITWDAFLLQYNNCSDVAAATVKYARNARKMPYNYGVIMSKRGPNKKVVYKRWNTVVVTP